MEREEESMKKLLKYLCILLLLIFNVMLKLSASSAKLYLNFLLYSCFLLK